MSESRQGLAEPSDASETTGKPYVPIIEAAELLRRNWAAVRLLDAWEADEASDQEQRETLAILKAALGEARVASSRNLFP
jgi:hypothetical protein